MGYSNYFTWGYVGKTLPPLYTPVCEFMEVYPHILPHGGTPGYTPISHTEYTLMYFTWGLRGVYPQLSLYQGIWGYIPMNSFIGGMWGYTPTYLHMRVYRGVYPLHQSDKVQ